MDTIETTVNKLWERYRGLTGDFYRNLQDAVKLKSYYETRLAELERENDRIIRESIRLEKEIEEYQLKTVNETIQMLSMI